MVLHDFTCENPHHNKIALHTLVHDMEMSLKSVFSGKSGTKEDSTWKLKGFSYGDSLRTLLEPFSQCVAACPTLSWSPFDPGFKYSLL